MQRKERAYLSRLLLMKQKKRKKHREKKYARKGGKLPFFSHFHIWDEMFFLPSPLHVPSTLNSPPSSSLVSHISSNSLCYSCLGDFPNFGVRVSGNWSEGCKRQEVGRKGNFWGKEGGWKILGQGKRMCFWFIPKTAWTASSWTSALEATSSLQPCSYNLDLSWHQLVRIRTMEKMFC
jgi:hypothetical protein